MSLPLLSRIVVDTIEGASARIGWLYGLNTLGAAAGALLTGWILIGTLGFAVTVYAAAAINFLIGGTALLASGELSSLRPSSIGRMTHRSDSESRHRLLLWSLMVVVSGFLIISLEIVWFRVLGTLTHSNAYAFSLILGISCLGTGSVSSLEQKWRLRSSTRAARSSCCRGLWAYTRSSLSQRFSPSTRIPGSPYSGYSGQGLCARSIYGCDHVAHCVATRFLAWHVLSDNAARNPGRSRYGRPPCRARTAVQHPG
jgi:hypothetical protein